MVWLAFRSYLSSIYLQKRVIILQDVIEEKRVKNNNNRLTDCERDNKRIANCGRVECEQSYVPAQLEEEERKTAKIYPK